MKKKLVVITEETARSLSNEKLLDYLLQAAFQIVFAPKGKVQLANLQVLSVETLQRMNGGDSDGKCDC